MQICGAVVYMYVFYIYVDYGVLKMVHTNTGIYKLYILISFLYLWSKYIPYILYTNKYHYKPLWYLVYTNIYFIVIILCDNPMKPISIHKYPHYPIFMRLSAPSPEHPINYTP